MSKLCNCLEQHSGPCHTTPPSTEDWRDDFETLWLASFGMCGDINKEEYKYLVDFVAKHGEIALENGLTEGYQQGYIDGSRDKSTPTNSKE